MMPAPAWCESYTRLEYQDKGRGPVGFDCWGFVRLVQREQFKVIDLPDLYGDYPSAEDHAAVARTVVEWKQMLSPFWRRSFEPRAGDIIIIKIATRPWHCGVCVGGDWMLHILKGVNVGLEHFRREPWRNRIEGFYRHV
jgi:cell wall-associated NlpC family hydrolase